MKKLILNFLAFSVFIGPFSWANQELTTLIRCHEALDGKSEGRSEKLSTTSATPFMIPSGKELYFVTESSVSVLKNDFADKDIVVRLEEKDGPVFRKIGFRKDGSLAVVSFQDLSKEQKQNALSPRSKLDPASLEIIKKDLVKRMNSVTGEYQNKYDPEGTVDALNTCASVKSAELQKSLDKQVAFYKKLVKKKSSDAYQGSRTNSGSK